jgi:hypothetical protein
MAKNKKPKKRKKLKFVKAPVLDQANSTLKKWEITIDKEGFNKIKHNLEFIQILNLARVTNALNFCYKALLDAGMAETPSGKRQLFYAMSFSNAVLFEGLVFAEKLENYFFDYDSYKKGFEVLLSDPVTKEIRSDGSRFNKIRNRMTYHFSPSIFEEVLRWAEFDTYVFGSSYGESNGDTFYSLPEDYAINFIIGKHSEIEEGKQIYEKMVQEIVSVMTRFFNSSQELIAEALLKKGWKIEEIKDSDNSQ